MISRYLLLMSTTCFMYAMDMPVIEGANDIHWAVMKGDIEELTHVLKTTKDDVNARTVHGGNAPIHYACAFLREPSQCKPIIASLVEHKADLNIQDNHGNRILDSVLIEILGMAGAHVYTHGKVKKRLDVEIIRQVSPSGHMLPIMKALEKLEKYIGYDWPLPKDIKEDLEAAGVHADLKVSNYTRNIDLCNFVEMYRFLKAKGARLSMAIEAVYDCSAAKTVSQPANDAMFLTSSFQEINISSVYDCSEQKQDEHVVVEYEY